MFVTEIDTSLANPVLCISFQTKRDFFLFSNALTSTQKLVMNIDPRDRLVCPWVHTGAGGLGERALPSPLFGARDPKSQKKK